MTAGRGKLAGACTRVLLLLLLKQRVAVCGPACDSCSRRARACCPPARRRASCLPARSWATCSRARPTGTRRRPSTSRRAPAARWLRRWRPRATLSSWCAPPRACLGGPLSYLGRPAGALLQLFKWPAVCSGVLGCSCGQGWQPALRALAAGGHLPPSASPRLHSLAPPQAQYTRSSGASPDYLFLLQVRRPLAACPCGVAVQPHRSCRLPACHLQRHACMPWHPRRTCRCHLPCLLTWPPPLQRLMIDNPEAAANLAKMVAKQVGWARVWPDALRGDCAYCVLALAVPAPRLRSAWLPSHPPPFLLLSASRARLCSSAVRARLCTDPALCAPPRPSRSPARPWTSTPWPTCSCSATWCGRPPPSCWTCCR